MMFSGLTPSSKALFTALNSAQLDMNQISNTFSDPGWRVGLFFAR
jgi:hypothetical protein